MRAAIIAQYHRAWLRGCMANRRDALAAARIARRDRVDAARARRDAAIARARAECSREIDAARGDVDDAQRLLRKERWYQIGLAIALRRPRQTPGQIAHRHAARRDAAIARRERKREQWRHEHAREVERAEISRLERQSERAIRAHVAELARAGPTIDARGYPPSWDLVAEAAE